MPVCTKCKILYKMNSGKMLYVSDYTITKMKGGRILGACKFSPNITDAKIVPGDIIRSEIADDSVRMIDLNIPVYSV